MVKIHKRTSDSIPWGQENNPLKVPNRYLDVTRRNLLATMLRSAALLLVFATHAHAVGFRAIVSPYMTWEDARISCVAQGGSLAKLPSLVSDLSTIQTLSCLEFAWVGATDEATEGTFKWLDGSTLPLGDIMWGTGQPGATEIFSGQEDCVMLGWVGDPNKLHDAPCEEHFPFVCQINTLTSNEIGTVESPTSTSADLLSSCDDGVFYRVIHTKMTHSEAFSSCAFQGGTLAGFPTSANARRIAGLKCAWSYWVGLTDKDEEGTWEQPDGTTVIEHSGLWQRGEPNSNEGVDEDCSIIGYSSRVKAKPPNPYTLNPNP